MKSEHDGLSVVSLFSGAGGMDLGFAQAGHTIVWANDISDDAVETYKNNIGRDIISGNIAEIDSAGIPEHDILIGGLPCQGFSHANVHKLKVDERNNLYVQFVRALREKAPAFFMIENVRGMTWLEGGAVFQRILRALESSSDCGYSVMHRTINAADFGVPQQRIRVIIVGVRRDLSAQLRYEFPTPTHARNPNGTGLRPWLTIGEVLSEIPEPTDEHELLNHVASKYKVTNRDFIGHRATDPAKPSPTILARGDGRGGVCAIQHPKNHRRLTVRESAIVQTFPLNFRFSGKLMSMYRQVGNAVPVKLAECLAGGFAAREEGFPIPPGRKRRTAKTSSLHSAGCQRSVDGCECEA